MMRVPWSQQTAVFAQSGPCTSGLSHVAWYRRFLRSSQERTRANRALREQEQARKAKEQARAAKEAARKAR